MFEATIASLNADFQAARWLSRREMLVAELLNLAPDLIALQQLPLPFGQAYWLRNQLNYRLSGSWRRPYQMVLKRRPLGHGLRQGSAILSKLPVLSRDSLPLGYGRTALRINVQLPGGHLADFVSVDMHPVSYDYGARQEQVMQLVGWLNGIGRVSYQFVAASFYEGPNDPAVQYMKQTYQSLYERFRGREPLATYPTLMGDTDLPWATCLDYLFASNDVTSILEARLWANQPAAGDDTLYLSGHVGLWARIGLV